MHGFWAKTLAGVVRLQVFVSYLPTHPQGGNGAEEDAVAGAVVLLVDTTLSSLTGLQLGHQPYSRASDLSPPPSSRPLSKWSWKRGFSQSSSYREYADDEFCPFQPERPCIQSSSCTACLEQLGSSSHPTFSALPNAPPVPPPRPRHCQLRLQARYHQEDKKKTAQNASGVRLLVGIGIL